MRQSYFVLLLLFSAALRGETIPGEFAGQPPLQTVEVTPVPHLVVRQQPYLDGQDWSIRVMRALITIQ